MLTLYDIAYGLGVGIAAPYWLIVPSARRKVLAAFRQRNGEDVPQRVADKPAVMIHAVSLGEMNATRALVNMLREMRPGMEFIVSATTDTGLARGKELYGPFLDVMVIRYPLDFSAAVARTLDAMKPDVVVLMELEVWPNFLKACTAREIPVIL